MPDWLTYRLLSSLAFLVVLLRMALSNWRGLRRRGAFPHAAVFAAIWFWLALVFLVASWLLALSLAGAGGLPGLPLAADGLALGLWGLAIGRLRLPPALRAAYPFSVGLAAYSRVATRRGKVIGKQWPLAARR